MTYFDPTPKPQHRCKCPDPNHYFHPPGWRCECGKAYVRYQESQHGKSWWAWKRAPEHDEEANRAR